MIDPVLFKSHSIMIPTQVEQRKTLGTWVVDDLYYGGFKKFLKLFENYDDRHIDYGNGMLYYKNKMAYSYRYRSKTGIFTIYRISITKFTY